jgi:C1A family cysteine protease
MAINKFSDLTPSEFKELYVGKMYRSSDFGCISTDLDTQTDIETFDWRNYNVVNPVRNQGQCGSCWAFATTANAESVWAIHTGNLYDLSEQYLVDCATGIGYFNMGCDGGNMDSAFKYMINNKQCNESAYPYTSGVTESKGKCHSCNEFTTFSSCYDVMTKNQLALKMAVMQNPVVIGIEADTYYFQSYSSGILTSELCGTTIDHAVEIVGFGIDNGIKYWSVRNSWGDDWGEDGYFRILRTDSTDDAGICGLALEPSFISV